MEAKASSTPRPFYPHRNSTWYQLNTRLGGPRPFRDSKDDPSFSCSQPGHYTDWATGEDRNTMYPLTDGQKNQFRRSSFRRRMAQHNSRSACSAQRTVRCSHLFSTRFQHVVEVLAVGNLYDVVAERNIHEATAQNVTLLGPNWPAH